MKCQSRMKCMQWHMSKYEYHYRYSVKQKIYIGHCSSKNTKRPNISRGCVVTRSKWTHRLQAIFNNDFTSESDSESFVFENRLSFDEFATRVHCCRFCAPIG